MRAGANQGGRFRIDAAGAGVCAVISLLWYLAAISPLLEQRSVTADLRQQIEGQQQKARELRAAMASAQQQLDIVRRELTESGLQLDSAAHINRRIAVLTEFFAECTLHIDDVQTGQICSGLQCDLVPITIIGRGAYPHCVRLLHRLGATFPDMRVTRVEFRGTPARAAESEQFHLEMFWYAAPNSGMESASREDDRRLVASELWGPAQ